MNQTVPAVQNTQTVSAVSNPSAPLLHSIKEVCYQLGISKRAVYYLIARGDLPVLRIGGRTLVRRVALEEFASRDHIDLIVSTAMVCGTAKYAVKVVV
jgi:excisionase family DNA binding protein